jgi:hypothetical protein
MVQNPLTLLCGRFTGLNGKSGGKEPPRYTRFTTNMPGKLAD